jgi:hypothetical protein
MKSRGLVLLLFLFAFVAVPRLPAPIVEEEKPTPAPEQSAKPKPKRTTKSNATTKSSEGVSKLKTASSPQIAPSPNRTPFAGTWVGVGGWSSGLSVVVSSGQDSVLVQGIKDMWGNRRGQATVNGNTLSWGFLLEKWTMVLGKDGKTAVVTAHGWPTGVYSGTFQKVP